MLLGSKDGKWLLDFESTERRVELSGTEINELMDYFRAKFVEGDEGIMKVNDEITRRVKNGSV